LRFSASRCVSRAAEFYRDAFAACREAFSSQFFAVLTKIAARHFQRFRVMFRHRRFKRCALFLRRLLLIAALFQIAISTDISGRVAACFQRQTACVFHACFASYRLTPRQPTRDFVVCARFAVQVSRVNTLPFFVVHHAVTCFFWFFQRILMQAGVFLPSRFHRRALFRLPGFSPTSPKYRCPSSTVTFI